jgi:hypothetical protein
MAPRTKDLEDCLRALLDAERVGGVHMDGSRDFAGVSPLQIRTVLHKARRLLGEQPVRYSGE